MLDLEARAGEGEEGADFEVPGAEWAQLVRLAQSEPHRSPATGETDAELEARGIAPGLGAHQSYGKGTEEDLRNALAQALGVGADTSWPEIVEVARGYSMALDAEHQRDKEFEDLRRLKAETEARRGTDKGYEFARGLNTVECVAYRSDKKGEAGFVRLLLGEPQGGVILTIPEGRMLADVLLEQADKAWEGHESPKPPARAKRGAKVEASPEEEPEHPECPTCGEADGHKPEDCANKGWAKPTPAELAAESLLRLNGAAWKRHAKAARETNSLEVCHHCGAGDQIAVELEYSKGDEVLPTAMLCAGCRERLRFHPDEWIRRHGPTMIESLERAEAEAAAPKKQRGKRKGQVTLDEAVEAASPKPRAPGRPTKKFPLGGSDPTEKCTQCGAELGEHDGTKCPRAALQRGTVAIHDQQEGAPF